MPVGKYSINTIEYVMTLLFIFHYTRTVIIILVDKYLLKYVYKDRIIDLPLFKRTTKP